MMAASAWFQNDAGATLRAGSGSGRCCPGLMRQDLRGLSDCTLKKV